MDPLGYSLEPDSIASVAIVQFRTRVVVGIWIAAGGANSVDDAGAKRPVQADLRPFDPRYLDDSCANKSIIFFTIDEGRADGMVT